MTAMTFMMEKTNSASPYPLAPKRLITTIVMKKMETWPRMSTLSIRLADF